MTEVCTTGDSFETGTEIFSPAPLPDWLWAQKLSYPNGIRTIFPEYQAAWEWICTFTPHIRLHVLTLSWAGGNCTFIFTVTYLTNMLHYHLPLERRLRGSRSLPGFEPWSLVRCQYFAVFHRSLTPKMKSQKSELKCDVWESSVFAHVAVLKASATVKGFLMGRHIIKIHSRNPVNVHVCL